MEPTDLKERLARLQLAEPGFAAAGRSIDTGRAWLEFQRLRSRARRNRRARVVASASAAVAVAIAAILVIPSLTPSRPGGPNPHATATKGTRRPGNVPKFPAAVIARIPVDGVGVVVQEGASAWAIRSTGTARQSVQLLRISLRSDKITLRVNIGHDPQDTVAAGARTVWVTTQYGRVRGQLARINPATGQIMTTLHLAAGKCSYLGYGGGQLWAQCRIAGAGGSQFLSINSATGRVDAHSGPLTRYLGPVTATPDGVWFANTSNGARAGIEGLVWTGSRLRVIKVHDAAYPVSFGLTSSLVYASGFVWALTTDESVAKISTVNGRVVRIYTYRNYDPTDAGGLDFLTASQGSLWFLDDGGLNVNAKPVTGVLRVSMRTGRPLGFVPGSTGSPCGEPCFQIYSTSSAIWLPTSGKLLRIDPARLPH